MSKRAAQARDHLLQFGTLTTEQLSAMGYVHPPRAIGDLQDAGATIERRTVRSSEGKRIAEYTLVAEVTAGRAGRVNLPKAFREELNRLNGNHCAICNGIFENRELQADHRIPFRIAGDKAELDFDDFMPLCASDNRSKSWSCENCPNWDEQSQAICGTCFWAHPEKYLHVATRMERRVDLIYQDEAVVKIDRFAASLLPEDTLSAAVKRILDERLDDAE